MAELWNRTKMKIAQSRLMRHKRWFFSDVALSTVAACDARRNVRSTCICLGTYAVRIVRRRKRLAPEDIGPEARRLFSGRMIRATWRDTWYAIPEQT